MSDQINKDGSINHRPDLDPLPRTADEWNDETVLLRRQLTAAQARVKELEQREVRPRVHGNGFIQLDLSKSKRLHIFGDPIIPKQVVETPIHDHTFGFTSEILSGELTNVWLDLVDDQDGTHDVFQARVRDREDTILENTGRRVRLVERKRITFRAGDSYSMLPGEFHESLATGRTVTIITKDGPSLAQGGLSPRVLVRVGSTPDNDFNRYAESPKTLWRIITGGERIATLEQDNAALEISHQHDHEGINAYSTALFGRPDIGYTDGIRHIATLEQALKASNNQILELINGGASLLAHRPDAPLLSDAGTAQSFFRVQVTLAKEVINANLKTIGNSA